nr:ABC transporter permease [uncultured Flavobacterium sp.]
MNKKETSNFVAIKKFLPHRAPMLMVDMILEMDDEKVETIFEIREDNIFLENGFFTESGLVENMAQTCSAVVAKNYFINENDIDKSGINVVGFISGIKTLQIHSLPQVNNVVVTKALLVSKFITESYSLCTMKCKASRAEELLLEGEITLYIQESKL